MTIYDLARITGYSSATVARALSGKGYCSKKAKKEITETASKMNYCINSQAKALRSAKTSKILCCIPDICNPFYFRMIKGITETLEKKDYILMLYPTDKDLQKELSAIDLCRTKFCDGLILISFDFRNSNIQAIRSSGVPAVLGNRYLKQKASDNFDYVYVDHILGMELATKRLIEQGCKHIVLASGDLRTQTSSERAEGYRKALTEAHMEVDERYIINGNYEKNASFSAMEEFQKSGLPFDGIIAGNDLSAYGILEFAQKNNISIPSEVKLVSFDNTDYAVVSKPSLTSIDMRQYELGVSLATSLLERIEGRSFVKNTIINPCLVVRESA
jgi:DNA-binding LacI/PurR family transcriptional regulator